MSNNATELEELLQGIAELAKSADKRAKCILRTGAPFLIAGSLVMRANVFAGVAVFIIGALVANHGCRKLSERYASKLKADVEKYQLMLASEKAILRKEAEDLAQQSFTDEEFDSGVKQVSELLTSLSAEAA